MSPVQPEAGDFFVTATKGPWLDRLAAHVIQWDTATDDDGHFTDSPVNHAGLSTGGDTIAEALRRFDYGTAGEYPDAIWSTGRLPARLTPAPEQRTLIVNATHDMIGLRYNVLDLFEIGLAQRRMHDMVTSDSRLARRVDRRNKVICSEAVVRAYRAAGIDLFPGRLAALVSPGDLYELLVPAQS